MGPSLVLVLMLISTHLGKLPIRVFLTPDIDELGSPDIVPAKWSEGLITCNRIKLFADGSLGAVSLSIASKPSAQDRTLISHGR